MRKIRVKVGERIQSLELAIGSQKLLAKSLGVSTRTIRRWKHIDTIEIPSKKHKLDPQKLVVRERYYATRFEEVQLPRTPREITLNDFIEIEWLTDLAAEMDLRYPKLVKKLLRDRPDIQITVLVFKTDSGGLDIQVPGKNPADFERLTFEGYSVKTHYIPGKSYQDWPSLSSWFWRIFRAINPEGSTP